MLANNRPSGPPLALQGLHLPPPPGWWPPAPGWWLLVLLALGLLFILFLLWQRASRLRYRRAALRQLQALAANDSLPEESLVAELSALLRRAALCAFPNDVCAGLSGAEWLLFLDRPLKGAPFSSGVGRVLGSGPYQRRVEIERAELLALCRRWLRRLPPTPRPGRGG